MPKILKFLSRVFIILLSVWLFSFQILAAEGDILFFDDFNDGNFDGWTITSGNWSVNNGNLLAKESGIIEFRGQIHAGNTDWDNYRIELDILNEAGVDEGIDFRRADDNNYYAYNLRHGSGEYGTPEIKLFKVENNNAVMVQSTRDNIQLLHNIWYHIKIEVLNENIKLWINNSLILEYSDPVTNFKKGAIGVYSWTGAPGILTARFDNVKVTSLSNFPAPNPTPGPTPFLDLPWDYEGKGLSFNEAVNAITSYFDHQYPLLSSGLSEPNDISANVIIFRGPPNTNDNYSSHDGYDYGKLAKVNIGDPVLAAAAGTATYINICSACGNMIVIDHGNGYQTRYLHLQKDGLITNIPGQKVNVSARQQVGKVGATGNVSPPGDAGAHIHFGVFQDKNKDGNFEDNVPDGATDPFGWQSKDPDPWPTFTFSYGGQSRTGNKSYYLWTKKIDNLDVTLTSNGGVFKTERYAVNFPQNATKQNLNLTIKSSPVVKANSLSSIGSTIIAEARDLLGNLITNFQKAFTLFVDFSSFDLTRYKTDTISIYSSQDGVNWNKEPTILDLTTKTASAELTHFSHFALMAERVDTTSPTTTAILTGQRGQDNWFRSDVQVSLNAQDNPGGLGVDYTMYRLPGGDWEIYSGLLNFSSEGHYKIEFYSADKDENLEEIKSKEFDIDKTPPSVLIDANPKILWPPNGKMVDVNVTGSSTDSHLKSTDIKVEDEYHQIEPKISGFGQIIQLEAKREASDKDGRVYIIKVVTEDLAGNITEKQTQVIVPHDQR